MTYLAVRPPPKSSVPRKPSCEAMLPPSVMRLLLNEPLATAANASATP